MAGPAFNKFNGFVVSVGSALINLPSDALKVMLCDVAPVAANNKNTDLTEIAAGNGYVAGGAAAAFVSWAQSGGLATLKLTAPTFTASGGSMASFRYIVLYDSTTGYLIGWWDWGSEVVLPNGGQFTPTFDATNGVLTLQ